jgi:hypothetical protein
MTYQNPPRGGIVQPNSKHSYRVKFRGGFIDTSESYLDFMQNMISVDLDLVAKRITLVPGRHSGARLTAYRKNAEAV